MNYKKTLSLWLVLLVSFHATHLFADIVKGNPDTKVCHMDMCKYANSKGCTMAFDNMDEAEKMGYRMCTKCSKRMMRTCEMGEKMMPMNQNMMGKKMMMMGKMMMDSEMSDMQMKDASMKKMMTCMQMMVRCMDEMMSCMHDMQPEDMMP
jgi:hypothetical protein